MTSANPSDTQSTDPESIPDAATSATPAPSQPSSSPLPPRSNLMRDQAIKTLGNPWLLAVLLIAGLAGWQWYSGRQQLVQQQQSWEKRLADADLASQEIRSLAKQLQEQNQALNTRFVSLEERLDQDSGIQTTLRDLAVNRDLATLAEIEHVLVLTLQQLHLNGDVATALNTLLAIDGRLSKFDRAQFMLLRKAIAHDIERLRKVPIADLAGMSLRLENFLVGIDQLPFEMEARPVAPTPVLDTSEYPATARLLNSLWTEIKGLVRIERMDGDSPLLLTNEQQFFVRESLKLRMLSARLSLLARDPRSFRHELEASQILLGRHFNHDDKTVQNTLSALQQLAATPLQVETPSLNESLSAVRHAQQLTEKKSKP
jgi:uroporphyrin-III C-methyltransferase